MSMSWVVLGLSLLVGIIAILLIRKILNDDRSSQAGDSQPSGADRQLSFAEQSIYTLARTIVADQIELSEACVRIKVLLDAIPQRTDWDIDLSVFEEVYSKLSEHPTRNARADISPSERLRWDKERWRIEGEYKESIVLAAQRLLKKFAV